MATSVSFAHAWSTTLHDLTIREVFDLIAQRLGPTYGWQFSGAQDFRIITFHQGLLPNPSRSEHARSQEAGGR